MDWLLTIALGFLGGAVGCVIPLLFIEFMDKIAEKKIKKKYGIKTDGMSNKEAPESIKLQIAVAYAHKLGTIECWHALKRIDEFVKAKGGGLEEKAAITYLFRYIQDLYQRGSRKQQ